MVQRFLAAVIGAAAISVGAAQQCSISGRVFDDRGRPVKFAVVNVVANPTFGAETDERGSYCISAPAGRYRVRAYARARPPSASPSCKSCCLPATDFAATFYPRAVNAGKGASGIDIRLRSVAVYCVRGEVHDQSGTLVKGASLGLSMDDLGASAGVITEAGRFLLTNLTPGAYALVLTDGRPQGQVLARRGFRITDHNIDNFVITRPGAR